MTKYNNKFQEEIETHLIDFKTKNQYLPPTGKKRWYYHDLGDNLFPPIKHGFLHYIYEKNIPLHDFANHVRSSQIFCVNLFYPLITAEETVLFKVFGDKIGSQFIKIIDFEFEYSSDKNILGEWKTEEDRPEDYVTAVDVMIKLLDINNQSHCFLIEVKFSEDEFTPCGGYNSNGNKDKGKCKKGNLILNDLNTCYLKNHPRGSRKYFDFFSALDFNKNAFEQHCPFINNHQCIRNLALARAIKKSKDADYTYFILAHHDENTAIINQWNQNIESFSYQTQKEFIRIPYSEFLLVSKNMSLKKYFNDRYLINPST